MPEPGRVIWITGLPGAGKSTIARETVSRLRERGVPVALIDGDEFRAMMGNDLGHGMKDRRVNALRICRFCGFLSGQGITVVAATVSLFSECHEWNRANIPDYVEVFVKTREETRKARDTKGLLKAASGGTPKGVVGVDQPFEEPKDPHLVLDNDEDGAAAALAERILESLPGGRA